MEINKIYNQDCIEGMKAVETGSVDMILCDLPYGVTDCKWDSVIPFDELWREYERIIKPNGAIVLTATQPFTNQLINSNKRLFRYCWYWVKNIATGFPFSRFQPLRCVEEVCVFYDRAPVYNPQGLKRLEKPVVRKKAKRDDTVYRSDSLSNEYVQYYTNYPRNVIYANCERGLHPTQKPVKLFSYLIKTYTNPGDLVLDSCIGSGTTAIACIRTGRSFIGFEKSSGYYKKAVERIENEMKNSVNGGG